MSPAFYPSSRSQYVAPVYPAAAQSSSRSANPLSSYTSLDHALDPPGARETIRPPHQPPPSQSAQSSPPPMTSDSRYAYHTPPETAPPYVYPTYAPPYGHGQYAQGTSARPPSSSSQSSHPPPTAPSPYHAPPPGYPAHPSYGPPTYGVPPAPPGPWTGEAWSHYPHYAPPHPPSQEPPYSSNGSRSDPPADDHRPYPPPPARGEERSSRPAEAPPQSKVRNGRESEPPAPAPPRSPPLDLDFGKLLEQYGIVLETTASLTHPGNSPRLSIPQETLERMEQAASFGAQSLDSVHRRTAPGEPPRPPPKERSPEEAHNDGGDANSRQPPQPGPGENGEGQTCLGCNATSTPEWRRGPMGPRTLCNACGLVYAKLIKKRNRDPNRGRGAYLGPQPGTQNATNFVDESGHASSGGSDDEDSYGSQDRRSDGGYRGGRD